MYVSTIYVIIHRSAYTYIHYYTYTRTHGCYYSNIKNYYNMPSIPKATDFGLESLKTLKKVTICLFSEEVVFHPKNVLEN